jgi:hypothetical protein
MTPLRLSGCQGLLLKNRWSCEQPFWLLIWLHLIVTSRRHLRRARWRLGPAADQPDRPARAGTHRCGLPRVPLRRPARKADDFAKGAGTEFGEPGLGAEAADFAAMRTFLKRLALEESAELVAVETVMAGPGEWGRR